MKFKTGDRVVCMNPNGTVKLGKIYVVSGYQDEQEFGPHPLLELEGIEDEGFFEDRFEHAKTEQEIAKEQQKINAAVSDAFFQSLDKCLQNGQSTPKNDAKG